MMNIFATRNLGMFLQPHNSEKQFFCSESKLLSYISASGPSAMSAAPTQVALDLRM